MPLAFVGEQSLQYHNGTRERIHSSYTFANGTGFHTEDYPAPAPGTSGPGAALSFLSRWQPRAMSARRAGPPWCRWRIVRLRRTPPRRVPSE